MSRGRARRRGKPIPSTIGSAPASPPSPGVRRQTRIDAAQFAGHPAGAGWSTERIISRTRRCSGRVAPRATSPSLSPGHFRTRCVLNQLYLVEAELPSPPRERSRDRPGAGVRDASLEDWWQVLGWIQTRFRTCDFMRTLRWPAATLAGLEGNVLDETLGGRDRSRRARDSRARCAAAWTSEAERPMQTGRTPPRRNPLAGHPALG